MGRHRGETMRNQVGSYRFVGSFAEEFPTLGLPEIAFAGRSNVGKSSTLNCLLNSRKAARVSGTPGRTQMINFFQVGKACVFADLPGYGFAKVPDDVAEKWKGIIESYLGDREELSLVICLIDTRRDPLPMDLELVRGLREAGIPVQCVATKVDKLKRTERRKQLAAIRQAFELEDNELIAFSAKKREGREQIWDAIERAARR